jgi:hypothetical protein
MEGQGPRQNKSKKKEKEKDESAAVAEEKEEQFFTFTYTSNYITVAEALQIPKSRLGACINSGASQHYCPDHSKFEDYKLIEGHKITAADGRTLKAIGIGNVHIELPNRSK